MKVNKLVLERESEFVDVNIKIDSYRDELLSVVFYNSNVIYLYSFLDIDKIHSMLEDSGLSIIEEDQISIYGKESMQLCLDMLYETIVSEPVYLKKSDIFNNIYLN